MLRRGLCDPGGTSAGANLFHRFSAFDTRGGITGVSLDVAGHRNVMVGVTHPLGSFIDKAITLSGPANLVWLSPGGSGSAAPAPSPMLSNST